MFTWPIEDNNQVLKFDNDGKLLSTWGGQGDATHQFDTPTTVAIDAEGNIYVAETTLGRIRKFDPHGKFLAQWVAKSSQTPLQGLSMVFDSQGNLFEVQYRDQHECKNTILTGRLVASWNACGSDRNSRWNPVAIAVDSRGLVYVSDFTVGRRICIFDNNGNYLGQFGKQGTGDNEFMGPADIGFDAQGNMYVADYSGGVVKVFSSK